MSSSTNDATAPGPQPHPDAPPTEVVDVSSWQTSTAAIEKSWNEMKVSHRRPRRGVFTSSIPPSKLMSNTATMEPTKSRKTLDTLSREESAYRSATNDSLPWSSMLPDSNTRMLDFPPPLAPADSSPLMSLGSASIATPRNVGNGHPMANSSHHRPTHERTSSSNSDNLPLCPPKTRRYTRSFSLTHATTSSLSSVDASIKSASSSPVPWEMENASPNLFPPLLSSLGGRRKKLHRAATLNPLMRTTSSPDVFSKTMDRGGGHHHNKPTLPPATPLVDKHRSTIQPSFEQLWETGSFHSAGGAAPYSVASANSPGGASMGSRKRGASATDDDDDFLDNDWCWNANSSATAASMDGTSGSHSGRRRRQRSRIFEDQTCAFVPPSRPLLAAHSVSPPPPQRVVKNKRTTHGYAGEESNDQDDSSDGDDVDGHKNMSYQSNMSEEPDVFTIGVVDRSSKQQTDDGASSDPVEAVLAYMPCADDLAYLRCELRNCYYQASFSNFYRLVPLATWDMARRNAFLDWAKYKLGFSLRPIGQSNVALQVPISQGQEILLVLDAAYQRWEHKNNDARRPVTPSQQQDALFGQDAVFAAAPSLSTSANRVAAATTFVPTLATATISGPVFRDATDMDLASTFGNLTMQDNAANRQSSGSMARSVTMELTGQAGEPRLAIMRPSFEHVASTDLMNHLHGGGSGAHSPENVQSDDDFDDDFCMLRQRPHAKLSMASSSVPGRASCDSALTAPTPQQMLFENVETPSMSRQPEGGWSSNPVPGRDWGLSEAGAPPILALLREQFEAAYKEAYPNGEDMTNCGGGNGLMVDFIPMMPLPTRDMLVPLDDDDVGGGGGGGTSAVEPVDDTEMEMEEEDDSRQKQRRRASLAKYHRMSLWRSSCRRSSVLQRPVFSSQQNKPVQGFCPINEFAEASSPPVFKEEAAEEGPFEKDVLLRTFTFLSEAEWRSASLVSRHWADIATIAYAEMLRDSVMPLEDAATTDGSGAVGHILTLKRSWDHLTSRFPWGRYLSDGSFKRVYKVFNLAVDRIEAISVMDMKTIGKKDTVGTELMVSALVSSLARRNVCPNFVLMRGMFSCPYEPSPEMWGCRDSKLANGPDYLHRKCRDIPRKPSTGYPGRFQYIRMELCDGGDVEEYIKSQPEEMLDGSCAQIILFQVAFALYAAADRFSLKHYDIKLLNVFLKRFNVGGNVVLRYALGSHIFALRMPAAQALLAKLADFGTADVDPNSNGEPVADAHFTTFENTPPDFLILGDYAVQGHGHDAFGLGLCMLHLFTGSRPYEEILEDVKCPSGLRKKLRACWEDDHHYSVIWGLIMTEVSHDEAGHIVEGDPDETFYDTFYRYLVLFGVPDERFGGDHTSPMWRAMTSLNVTKAKQISADVKVYRRDARIYSVRRGTNPYIARARAQLERMPGGLNLLFRLCAFDPDQRASAMTVLNSDFMENLREHRRTDYGCDDVVYSYMAFSTQA